MDDGMADNDGNDRTCDRCHHGCRRELTRFGELTSIKGVGRSIKAEVRCLRYMWACAVVGFFGVTVFNVWTLTDEFLQFGTGTKITERSRDLTDSGTDILLCNINPYSISAVDTSMRIVDSYQQLIKNWTESNNGSNWQRISQELLTGQLGLFQHLGQQATSNLSHQLNSLVLSCHVTLLDGVMEQTLPCSRANVKVEKVVHKEYFNCFKFYGEARNGSPRPSVGMSFLVHVFDIRDYNPEIVNGNTGKGAILTPVEKNSYPNPMTKGFEILPGYVNRLRYTRTHRLRLQDPWGNCKDRSELSERIAGLFTDGVGTSFLYTEELCLSTCIEFKIIQTCECQDAGQHGILLDVFKNITMCGSTNEGQDVLFKRMTCVQKWRSEFRRKCVSKCPPPCQEDYFNSQVSYLDMSYSEIANILNREKIEKSVPVLETDEVECLSGTNHRRLSVEMNNTQGGNTQSKASNNNNNNKTFSVLNEIRESNLSNFALIQLRRDGGSIFVVEDIKAMTVSDYMAKIGGTLNLWSGITVFVLVEVLDLILRLSTGSCRSGSVQNNEKEEIADDENCKYVLDEKKDLNLNSDDKPNGHVANSDVYF